MTRGYQATSGTWLQTALQGDFSVARVAQELRNQCAVLDSQRRDLGDEVAATSATSRRKELGEIEASNDSFLGDIPDEEMETWETAENEAQEAMAAMHNAKRTLKEARQRQNNVRLSRQYFRTNGRKPVVRTQASGRQQDSLPTMWPTWPPGGQLPPATAGGAVRQDSRAG